MSQKNPFPSLQSTQINNLKDTRIDFRADSFILHKCLKVTKHKIEGCWGMFRY
jgi:hypothetical protein